MVVGNGIRLYQIFFFALSTFIFGSFLLFALIDRSINAFALALVAAGLLYLANLFSSKFSDVLIKDNQFFISSFFKASRKIDVSLFDRVTEMNIVIYMPSSPYFTIHFKDGTRVNFMIKKSADISFPFQSKEKLAKKLSDEIDHIISIK